MSNTPSIVMLGAGSWGTALSILMAANGHSVRLWSHEPDHIAQMRASYENSRYLPGIPLPKNILFFDDLNEALDSQQDIFIAVPSFAFRAVLENIASLAKKPRRIAIGTKGLDVGTHLLLHQVVSEVLGKQTPVAVLSGPSFAKEVALQKPTAVSLAGNDETWVDELIQNLHHPFFRVYKNNDFIGLEICGAVKNVIAIAVGIIDGLNLGANARSALIARGLVEMGRLAMAIGGKSDTMLSLAGVGDLVLTCTDDQSRNRRFGFAIGKGTDTQQALKQIGQVVEGLGNAKEVYHLSQQLKIELPIIEQVYEVLYSKKTAQEAVRDLLARAPKLEIV